MGAAVSDHNQDALEGWTFTSGEVSVGVYRFSGRHYDGRSVERQGPDYEAIKADCMNDARTLEKPAYANRT